MANQWFRFKQFMVNQDRCAMKVGTDSVVLGVLCRLEGVHTILDAGTGTGVVSLMLAQRSSALEITGLEMDEAAAQQASENFLQSPFASRLSVVQCDLMLFEPDQGFDLFVANPPYFPNDLKANGAARSLARQGTQPVSEWIAAAARLINDNGRATFIIPVQISEELITAGHGVGLNPSHITTIYSEPHLPPRRTVIEFSKKLVPLSEDSLIIGTGRRGVYSDQFKLLVDPFYL